MQQPSILVLAAGMGSRYGGLKQLEPVGPNGETLLDYSVYDAIQAGFRRIVFIIRKDIEAPFRNTIGKRYEDRIEIDYAFQEIDDLPVGFTTTLDGRTKPWGTAHALYAARNSVKGSFAVINADDFYGREAFQILADHFKECDSSDKDPLCMVGYPLDHT
jgi:dTDP-glucose pyrophosphorylase